MISAPDRRRAVELIDEARKSGARLEPACRELGITARTYQRWTRGGQVRTDRRPEVPRPTPANKLSPEERESVLSACHDPRYAGLPPGQIVPKWADRGVYIALESSFYRILREVDEQHHRGRSRKPRASTPPKGYCATGPNQVWSWDITYLPTLVRGIFFYLYMIMDVFSRKIVGWDNKPTRRPTTFMMTTKFDNIRIIKVRHERTLNGSLSPVQEQYLLDLRLTSSIFTQPARSHISPGNDGTL